MSFFRGFIEFIQVVILLYVSFTRCEYVVSSSVFTSRPPLFRHISKVSALFFSLFFCFSCAVLMEYFTATFTSNGHNIEVRIPVIVLQHDILCCKDFLALSCTSARGSTPYRLYATACSIYLRLLSLSYGRLVMASHPIVTGTK